MQKLIFISLLLITFQSKAQLTLEEAVNIALKNNLDIKIAKNNFEVTLVNNHISVAGGLPVVSGTSSYNRSLTNLNQQLSSGTQTNRSNVSNNNLNAAVEGSFVLFNGYKVQAAKARLQALEVQSEQQVNAQIQNIIAAVMVSYYNIVRQQGYIKTIGEALSVTLQRKKIIEIKQSVGLANNADRFQAEIDSVASLQDLRTQQLILDQSRADLMNLLMQRPDSLFNIADTIVTDSSINLAEVSNRLHLNPDLLSAEQQIKINELVAKEIGSQRYPAISVNGGYNFSRSQNGAGFTLSNQTYGPYAGLGLNMPIFNGGLYRRQQKVADIDTRNARYTLQKLQNNLLTSAVKSYQSYQNSLLQLRTEKENYKTAAALLNLVYKRYELGVGTIIELRQVEQSYVEAGFRQVNASYAAKVAEIELKRLSSNLIPR